MACPARFERATYALEEFVAVRISLYFNGLDALIETVQCGLWGICAARLTMLQEIVFHSLIFITTGLLEQLSSTSLLQIVLCVTKERYLK